LPKDYFSQHPVKYLLVDMLAEGIWEQLLESTCESLQPQVIVVMGYPAEDLPTGLG
jgi:hypothetical protein